MSTNVIKFPRPTVPVTACDELDAIHDRLDATTNPVMRAKILIDGLHPYVLATIEAHGTFSVWDLAAYQDCVSLDTLPTITRTPRGTGPLFFTAPGHAVRCVDATNPILAGAKNALLREAKKSLLSGAEKSTEVTVTRLDSSLDSGEIAGSVIASDSQATIKGSSQRSLLPASSLNSTLENSTMIPCVSSSQSIQDVLKEMPAEWLPSGPRTGSFGLTQDDASSLNQDENDSTGERDEEVPSRKLDALQEILAPYVESETKVTKHFSARAIRAMRAKYSGCNKDSSPKAGTLNMAPILEGGNRIMLTVMLIEDGMENLTGADLYSIRKSLFERFLSAFNVPMSCIWKVEYVPAVKTKMVGKHATVGYAHLHFYLALPSTRSAHSRKSEFSKEFNGLDAEQWFEATVRDITGVKSPKKRRMTHVPKKNERGEYPAEYSNAVDQMTNYFAKQGVPYKAKVIQNYVPLNWLARGEINLKFWGWNALGTH